MTGVQTCALPIYGRTREVGRLIGVRRSWRRRRVAGKCLPHPLAPAREMQPPVGKWRVDALLVPVPSQKLEISSKRSFWYGRCRKNRSPESSPENFAGGEWFLTTIRLTVKYWEMGKVTGKKHGHRKVSRS